MKIDAVWIELEQESENAESAWLIRLASPRKGYPLYAAIDVRNKTRSVLLPVIRENLPHRSKWPECKGLALSIIALNKKQYFAVQLQKPEFSDVFTALAEDIVPRIASSIDDREAIGTFLARLMCWKNFLAACSGDWSEERQRGLWGELYVLRTHIVPILGSWHSVLGWKGQVAAHQDFQFPAGAIEVKTTMAKQPQTVRITSERQLDVTGVGDLLLHVVVVDEREVSPGHNKPGESLPDMIASIRSCLGDDNMALEKFDALLLEAGWLDSRSYTFENRRLTVRQELTFKVQPGFPCLVEKDLPTGVGDVGYSLALSSCHNFSIPTSNLDNILRNFSER